MLLVTADHGNAERMIDEEGKPVTKHTTYRGMYTLCVGTCKYMYIHVLCVGTYMYMYRVYCTSYS